MQERHRQWYYRGLLKSCNYSCSYCPFSKRKGSEREQREDEAALFCFVEALSLRLERKGEPECAVQIVPYGEALVYPYYWKALALLSQNPRIEAVGAQSNLSFPVQEMLRQYRELGGDLTKLRLWGTFHPQMTSLEEFTGQCYRLSEAKVQYCVGAVGVPEQLGEIRRLRQCIPKDVYLWINKMDGLGRNYTEEEKQAFLEIDDCFELELAHHPADAAVCADNCFVEADGQMYRCNLSRKSFGNLYLESEEEKKEEGTKCPSPDHQKESCGRRECSCYLAYCNRKEEKLSVFGTYPAFRIKTTSMYTRKVLSDAANRRQTEQQEPAGLPLKRS